MIVGMLSGRLDMESLSIFIGSLQRDPPPPNLMIV